MGRVATVNQIIPFSCVDGPGSRLVIFLQGCNFNCKNCHNPYTIDMCDSCGDCVATCPVGALSLTTEQEKSKVVWNSELCTRCDTCLATCPKQSSPKTRQYRVPEMLELIRKQVHFINGITVSGGEATLQLPFIIELFQAIKSSPDLSHLSCMVDSNGYVSEGGWQQVIPYLDGAMIDLKSWQEHTHRYITDRDNHRVFSSLKLLAAEGKLYEIRLLYIPKVSDFDSEVNAVAGYLNQLPASVRVKLNAFQHHGVTGEARLWGTCSEAQMLELAARLTERGVGNLVLPSVYL
ncbi:YjjW family glycine radical enzyme activase [Shewanella sp. Isolate13]|uniref:YjjW family glycine radical enzyme activase n=1 Tax=Shewanella sp. Isolate13 TaxID=2908531 RepID=UPI001EFE8B60|nr:YjjW family glycine radical enzyme activase [Shewanella sp. Isolate13]MCG9729486.1 YjjW family glycine radical enzyme activase [Shewanella sp. Isolate13]